MWSEHRTYVLYTWIIIIIVTREKKVSNNFWCVCELVSRIDIVIVTEFGSTFIDKPTWIMLIVHSLTMNAEVHEYHNIYIVIHVHSYHCSALSVQYSVFYVKCSMVSAVFWNGDNNFSNLIFIRTIIFVVIVLGHFFSFIFFHLASDVFIFLFTK